MAAVLAIDDLSLRLGAFALRDVRLELPDGEILVLLGPNGAGKSVLLETIAGFHRPLSGRIMIAGRDVTALAPERRRVGFMVQNYGLFPHLTVAQNVGVGFHASRAGRRATGAGIAGLLDRFDIRHLAARQPLTLSPGEKQRVALARALASRPDLFLFDEPFAALDSLTRDMLSLELAGFLRQSRIAALFVTHDHADALTLGDRIAVMKDGAIVQSGDVREVFRRPADPFVARFLGVENLVAARLAGEESGRWRAAVGGQILSVPKAEGVASGEVLLCIRAEDVRVDAADRTTPIEGEAGAVNRLAGKVVALRPAGPLHRLTLDCGFRLDAYVMARDCAALGIAPGVAVAATVDAAAIHVLPRS
jgi:ABC-type Fe3+/spermidine/putrescine transport system ATPase subunit